MLTGDELLYLLSEYNAKALRLEVLSKPSIGSKYTLFSSGKFAHNRVLTVSLVTCSSAVSKLFLDDAWLGGRCAPPDPVEESPNFQPAAKKKQSPL